MGNGSLEGKIMTTVFDVFNLRCLLAKIVVRRF